MPDPFHCRLKATALLVLLSLCSVLRGADYLYTHLAGPLGGPGNADGPAGVGRLNTPTAFAFDAQGNLIVVDYGNRTLRKITPQGQISTISEPLPGPAGVAVDADGTIYVSDSSTHVIYKLDASGAKTTWVGQPYYPIYDGAVQIGLSHDAQGDQARFFGPAAMVFDAQGNLYVADTGNHTIRKVTPDGTVSTFAGTPLMADTVDGNGAAARFRLPRSLAVDATDTLYVGEISAIRKIAPNGDVTTLAGQGNQPGSADGIGSAALFFRPGVALAPNGNLVVADTSNHIVRQVTPTGEVSTIAGVAGQSGRADGIGAQARFNSPRAVLVDATGRILVADTESDAIRQIASDGRVTTFAGVTGGFGMEDGTGAAASFDEPWGITLDRIGNAFVAERGGRRVRRITPEGMVTTLSESGSNMQGPSAIAIDATGNLIIAPARQDTVLKMTAQGSLLNMAGQPLQSDQAVGAGAFNRYTYLLGATMHADGSTYVSDQASRAIWRFSPTGEMSQLPIQWAEVPLAGPNGLAFDPAGNLYVADRTLNVIVKITPEGVLTVLAGMPHQWGYADGKGKDARFGGPCGVAVDGEGNVFVADTGTNTIRRITPDGTVTTIGGKFGIYGSADGIGEQAHFFAPHGLAIDDEGTLYIAEEWNHAIRKGQLAGPPVITTQPQSRAVTAGSSVTLSVTAAAVPSATYQWYFNGNPFQGATSTMLSLTDARAANAGDYTVVVTNELGSVISAKATLTVSATPAIPPPSASGGGGGGAPSVWFMGMLSVAALLRCLRRGHSG